ncbi:MAG TPA: hypothetical protein VFO01_03430 [Trebonia sp.]|nr:hypothetical protein [Trebonia sp.]
MAPAAGAASTALREKRPGSGCQAEPQPVLEAVDAGRAAPGGTSRGGELIAQLDVSLPGSGVFEDDIGLFCEQAGRAGGTEVAARLDSVTAILAALVLRQGRTAEETLDQLGPLWGWLTASRHGLVHADGEGFYDQDELILETG